jgi:hypothetical protein
MATRSERYRTKYFKSRGEAFAEYMLLADKLEEREELKYKAQLKVYDGAMRAYAKELDRLKKLRDGLSTKQIQANEAYSKYIANQENAGARLEFTSSEAFRRLQYSANASMARAMMFAGLKGTSNARNIDPTIGDIGKKAGTDGGTPAETAVLYNNAYAGAVAAPKDKDNADIGFAIAMDRHLDLKRNEYIGMGFDEKSASEAASADVSSELSEGDQGRLDNGNRLRIGVPTGSIGVIKDGRIEAVPLDSAGAIKKFGYKPADYTELMKNVDDRMTKLSRPGIPDAPVPGDLKEQQRDLYFDAMFPDDDPAYQLNRVMRGLSDVSDEDLLADIQRLTGYSRASAITDMGESSAGSSNDGGPVGGAPIGSAPIIPSLQAQPLTPEQMDAARNQLKDRAALRAADSITQDKQADRFRERMELEDAPLIIEDPEAVTPAMRVALLRGQAVEADQALKQVASNQADIEAASDDLAGGEEDMAVELTPKDQAKLDAARQATQDARLKSEAADDAFGTQVGRYRDFKAERELDEKAGKRRKLEVLPEPEAPPKPKGRKNEDDLSMLEESPADRDIRLRTESAIAAKKDYEAGLAEKKRKTPVGQEVQALWQANRNKGVESVAEMLDNVARTYKNDEQRLAAEVLFGLEYEEKRAPRMG